MQGNSCEESTKVSKNVILPETLHGQIDQELVDELEKADGGNNMKLMVSEHNVVWNMICRYNLLSFEQVDCKYSCKSACVYLFLTLLC